VLTLLGIDTSSFLEGAKNAAEMYLKDSPHNGALLFASKLAIYYENGCNILDAFLWNEELEDVGLWIRQLVAESLGKENIEGVPVGLTPTVSLGPRDLHSQLELYLGGPKNRFTLFIKSKKEIEDTVAETAYQNTIEAYTKEGLPFEQYEMEEINEKNIAEFFVFMMLTVVYLAEHLKVNAFDQPSVEDFKLKVHKDKSL
jgi:glucose-6-phosphate isomerase